MKTLFGLFVLVALISPEGRLAEAEASARSSFPVDMKREMQIVESKLVSFGFDRVRGQSQVLPTPFGTTSGEIPHASMLNADGRASCMNASPLKTTHCLPGIVVRDNPESCYEVRVQYEMANYYMLLLYADHSEQVAHRIASEYEPWSPNCLNAGPSGVIRHYPH